MSFDITNMVTLIRLGLSVRAKSSFYLLFHVVSDSGLMSHAARTDSPPLKRRSIEEPLDSTSGREDEVSDIIYGEIARLHHRFVVSIDPSQHPSSKVIRLLCRLGKSAETADVMSSCLWHK